MASREKQVAGAQEGQESRHWRRHLRERDIESIEFFVYGHFFLLPSLNYFWRRPNRGFVRFCQLIWIDT
jgi:hypothetical protein